MNQLKVEANIAVGSRGNPTVTNTVLNIADVSVPCTVLCCMFLTCCQLHPLYVSWLCCTNLIASSNRKHLITCICLIASSIHEFRVILSVSYKQGCFARPAAFDLTAGWFC